MTISKYDKYAILPTRCSKCNRLFIFEPYNNYYIGGWAGISVKCNKCLYCIEKEKNSGKSAERG